MSRDGDEVLALCGYVGLPVPRGAIPTDLSPVAGVVAVSAIEPVGSETGRETVIAGPAPQIVGVETALELVMTGAATQGVVAPMPQKDVTALAATEHV